MGQAGQTDPRSRAQKGRSLRNARGLPSLPSGKTPSKNRSSAGILQKGGSAWDQQTSVPLSMAGERARAGGRAGEAPLVDPSASIQSRMRESGSAGSGRQMYMTAPGTAPAAGSPGRGWGLGGTSPLDMVASPGHVPGEKWYNADGGGDGRPHTSYDGTNRTDV